MKQHKPITPVISDIDNALMIDTQPVGSWGADHGGNKPRVLGYADHGTAVDELRDVCSGLSYISIKCVWHSTCSKLL
jgi:hypothetical protein